MTKQRKNPRIVKAWLMLLGLMAGFVCGGALIEAGFRLVWILGFVFLALLWVFIGYKYSEIIE